MGKLGSACFGCKVGASGSLARGRAIGRASRSSLPQRTSIAVIRVAGEDGVGAVELFEGDDEGKFVLEG
jgi:hypothetical protein